MKIQTKSGEPTGFGYSCGYMLRRGEVSLFREHGIYHVRRHPDSPIGYAWESFRTLKPARKLFGDWVKEESSI